MSIASLLRFPPQPPATLAGRIAMIVSLLVQTIAMRYARTRREPVAALVIPYLQRTLRRLARLLDSPAAGRAPRRRRPRQATGRRAGGVSVALPRAYGWLLADLRHEAAVWRNQLERLLAEPAVHALIAATPAAGRLLRPLCHMLALRPGVLYPPRPAPAPPPEAAAEPPAPRRPRLRAPEPPAPPVRWPRFVSPAPKPA